ncbi:hypothetical protein KJS94_13035 [Flavihumibacter rivuli]|uniref:hypothetical protein n=1 Tax=Flavihumibacter rivuli TaxID=2838156 RepID=UPI001BDE2C13|nr:hypothetical protein [Flavihumibacter rivuli]ULQ55570.1 hypothetical protein KJS94_13035 [Flavihumibacter rivuli]
MVRLMLTMMVIFSIISCGPSTQIVKSWRDPGTTITPDSYNKVLVVGLLKNETSRRVLEDQLVAGMGGKGVASYNYYIEKDLTQDKANSFKDKLLADGFDGAIVMRLVNIEKETSYVPGTASYPGYYGGFGPYYYSSWNAFYSPGYYTTDKIYNVETNVYSLKQDKLIWTGITSTVNPSKVDKAINEIVTVIKDKMKSEGFLK